MSILKPRQVTKTIYQGDDFDQLRDLRRAADIARRMADEAKTAEAVYPGGERRLGDDDAPQSAKLVAEAEKAERAFDAFVDEAAERGVAVTLQTIGRKRFRDLMLAHEPRMVTVTEIPETPEGEQPAEPVTRQVVHDEDAEYEVNTQTFPMALLTYIDPRKSDVRTIAAPVFKDVGEVEEFIDDELSDGDFGPLWVAAYYLNRMPTADPQATRFFAKPPTTSETSR